MVGLKMESVLPEELVLEDTAIGDRVATAMAELTEVISVVFGWKYFCRFYAAIKF